jgi:hypothetical protein
MELVEVVLQGVVGVPALTRWTFPAGVAVIPAGAPEALVARAAYELLGAQSDGKLSGAGLDGQPSRAAVIVVGRDGRRYRLVWELGSGRRALQVMNGETLEVVSTSQAEIAQTLTAQVGFPQADALREIYLSFVEDLPSKRLQDALGQGGPTPSGKFGKALPPGFDVDDAPARDTDKPLPPGFDGAETTSLLATRPEAELRARLAEIRSRQEGTVDVSAIEFELDGLQKKTFELQGRRKPITDIDANVTTIDQQLERTAYLENLPADFAEKATRLTSIQAEHDIDISRLDAEAQVLVDSVRHLSEEVSGVSRRGGAKPLQAAMLDPYVKWGLVVGVAAIGVGFVGGFIASGLRYVALLDIPAFAVAVHGGMRLLGDLEEGASTRMKLKRIAEERRRAMERFAIDKEQLEGILSQHKMVLEQLPDLVQSFTVRRDLLARRAALVAERATLDADLSDLDGALRDNSERIALLEAHLQEAGSAYDPDVADLAREAEEIERVLRGELKAPSAAPPPPLPTPRLEDVGASGPVGVDVGLVMTRLASDLLVQPVDDTGAALAPRAGQLIAALTGQRFIGLEASSRGVSVVNADKTVTPFGALVGEDRDLVALGLRCAIVESATRVAGRLPVIFDRSLDQISVEKAPLVVKALQFMGALTQVICFTQRREFAAAGAIVQGQTPPAAT